VPGAPAHDAPLVIDGKPAWLLRSLGRRFTLLMLGAAPAWTAGLPVDTLQLDAANDVEDLVASRYDLQPGNAVLLRPDQHVCARWRTPTEAAVRAALARACALH
jgi:3-(3-hydroxy-phenyl)propionate hydroxylase